MPPKQRKIAIMGYRSVGMCDSLNIHVYIFITDIYFIFFIHIFSLTEISHIDNFYNVHINDRMIHKHQHVLINNTSNVLTLYIKLLTGKSSLSIQFVEGQFVDSYDPTIENSKKYNHIISCFILFQ